MHGKKTCFYGPKEKSGEHIGFDLSVSPSVRSKKFKLGFRNFIYGFLVKNSLSIFISCLNYLPLWSYAPFKG